MQTPYTHRRGAIMKIKCKTMSKLFTGNCRWHSHYPPSGSKSRGTRRRSECPVSHSPPSPAAACSCGSPTCCSTSRRWTPRSAAPHRWVRSPAPDGHRGRRAPWTGTGRCWPGRTGTPARREFRFLWREDGVRVYYGLTCVRVCEYFIDWPPHDTAVTGEGRQAYTHSCLCYAPRWCHLITMRSDTQQTHMQNLYHLSNVMMIMLLECRKCVDHTERRVLSKLMRCGKVATCGLRIYICMLSMDGIRMCYAVFHFIFRTAYFAQHSGDVITCGKTIAHTHKHGHTINHTSLLPKATQFRKKTTSIRECNYYWPSYRWAFWYGVN